MTNVILEKTARFYGIIERLQLIFNVGQKIFPRGDNTCTASDKKLGASLSVLEELVGCLSEAFKDHSEPEARLFSG